MTADRVAAGVAAAWRRRAGWIDGGSVHEIDGLVVALTNLPDPELNAAFVEHKPRDPVAVLAAADEWFGRNGQRIALDFERGRHPGVEMAAAALGLEIVASRPAMTLMVSDLGPEPVPAGVEIRLVEDAAGMAAVADLQVEIFGWTPEVAHGFCTPAALATPGVGFYLGLLDGAPVASAIAHVHEGTVGIFGVGVVPAARRRGIGTAITAVVIADAHEKADLAWLQATPEGLPFYERMGFDPAGVWTVRARP